MRHALTNYTECLTRFISRVDQHEDIIKCWNWTSTLNLGGYGNFYDSIKKKCFGAHVWLWKYINGPIPQGKELDHLCRNRRCVNPNHLEPVRRWENLARGVGKSNITHCPYGHEYTEENTYFRVGKGRECRTCAISRATKWNKENK